MRRIRGVGAVSGVNEVLPAGTNPRARNLTSRKEKELAVFGGSMQEIALMT